MLVTYWNWYKYKYLISSNTITISGLGWNKGKNPIFYIEIIHTKKYKDMKDITLPIKWNYLIFRVSINWNKDAEHFTFCIFLISRYWDITLEDIFWMQESLLLKIMWIFFNIIHGIVILKNGFYFLIENISLCLV